MAEIEPGTWCDHPTGECLYSAELAALRKDAERYRWLRDSERIPNDDSGDGHIVVCSGSGEDVLWGQSMDAAIDHDMRAVGGCLTALYKDMACI